MEINRCLVAPRMGSCRDLQGAALHRLWWRSLEKTPWSQGASGPNATSELRTQHSFTPAHTHRLHQQVLLDLKNNLLRQNSRNISFTEVAVSAFSAFTMACKHHPWRGPKCFHHPRSFPVSLPVPATTELISVPADSSILEVSYKWTQTVCDLCDCSFGLFSFPLASRFQGSSMAWCVSAHASPLCSL